MKTWAGATLGALFVLLWALSIESAPGVTMSEAVTDELLDEIAIAGRPDEVRDRLAQWEGLTDQVLLYPPSVGTSPERALENLHAIVDVFGD